MLSLDEHNQIVQKNCGYRNMAGVSCPICKTELQYVSPDVMLCSYPAQQVVKCYSCNYTGYKLV